MIPKKRALFISHDASRTGAPIMLLRFLRWLKGHSDWEFEILLAAGGELEAEFAAIAPTTTLISYQSLVQSALRFLGRTMRLPLNPGVRLLERIRKRVANKEFALIYSNTAANGELIKTLHGHCPILSHIHELDFYIVHRIGKATFQWVVAHSDAFIAVARAVRDNLIQKHGIPESRIELIYECIPIPSDQERKAEESFVRSLRSQLGIPGEAIIVGGAGTMDWRKGPDLFVVLAAEVLRRNPAVPIHFVWLGGQTSGLEYEQLVRDAALVSKHKHIHFLGSRKDAVAVMAAFDIFALVSREDPYPIVNLEAASVGRPTVCFDCAGGAPEFVEGDSGFVVPYFHLTTMADRIMELALSPELRNKLGNRAAEKVRERHDLSVIGQSLVAAMTRAAARTIP